MDRITFPLTQQAHGNALAVLQDFLMGLLQGDALPSVHQAVREELTAALPRERVTQTYGPATSKAVSLFQETNGLPVTGEVDEGTATVLNSLRESKVMTETTYVVDGRVTSQASAAIGNLKIKVVDKGVGGEATFAQATTNARGAFRATFSESLVKQRKKDRPDLQVQVFAGETRVGLSDVRYNASTHETFVVMVDKVEALVSEHETLTGALRVHHQGPLRALEETDQRQDVTFLANKSGWDARAVALAALADQFSAGTTSAGPSAATTTNGIEAPFFYALFRAGLPANDQAVYRTKPAAVEGIWNRAVKDGVIPKAMVDKVPTALEQFRTVAAQRLLTGPVLAGVSSFKDVLAVSLRDDVQRRKVADLYVRFADDPDTFWSQVRTGIGEAPARRLRLDGQLAYLTLNNAPLIGRLHAQAGGGGLTNAAALARTGFHRPEKWRESLGADPVPPEIPGGNDVEKRRNYAEFMAAQVRLSYPTTVVATMVGTGETPAGPPAVRAGVQEFLTAHDGVFEIGLHPVAQYVARRELDLRPDVVDEVARIQRVYQITPDDTALNGLLREGVDSAYAVVRYERDEFVRAFASTVGGEAKAAAIHTKAQQVHSAVLNVTLGFLSARTAPGVGVHSPASVVDPAPSPPEHSSDVLAYATLESLFGQMDFCACEHCRTVFSPAAYLVDLLLFIDRPASEVPAGFTNPQQVLLDRRPDLAHLPLTCENTNTPVPYIDLVNETLEYYVTHAYSLAGYAGHDTDDSVPPADLLASPQFVSDAAYAVLADSVFPPPLPFHQPLELLRRLFAGFDAPLPVVMADLARDDNLERPNPAGYGWRDVRMETLRLSRQEHRLLTERRTTGGATDIMLTIKELAGFDPSTSDADVLAKLSDAKTFVRRLDITYEQLTEILGTRFVNPHGTLIPRLERLGVPFATLRDLKDGTISADQFLVLVNPGLDADKYGGDIAAWVTDPDNYARIMSILTLTDPGTGALELRYANPDQAANAVRPFEFIRLIRFTRLWRKLGWTIQQTDKAVTALYPAAQAPDDPDDDVNAQRLDAGTSELLLSLGVIRRALDVLGLKPKQDLLPLLACVAPIDTYGEASLFRQMFLGPAALDPAFTEDGYGNYLVDPSARLLAHAATLRAAFTLRADEFEQITTALGYTLDTPLTLETVSAVFRRGWLARKLRLTARELLLLVPRTGLQPFGTPDPVRPGILLLAEFVARLRALGLSRAQALYLIWNQDLSGRSVPTERETTDFARVLRAALAAIDNEFALVDDPDGTIARARMTLVYGTDAADLFFGLLDGTFTTSVSYAHGEAELAQAILDVAAGRLRYDDFRKRLTCTGVLTAGLRDALKAVAGVTAAFQNAMDQLFTDNQAALAPFFSRYPELAPLYADYVASSDPLPQRRNTLLSAFLPELRRRRKRQQTLQSVSAAAGADIAFASALLDDAAVLHAAGDATRGALDDLSAVETLGLTAQFHDAGTATGTPASQRAAEANLDYAPGANPLPANGTTPGAAISAVWTGHLEVSEAGFYNIDIEADTGAVATLVLGDVPVPLAVDSGVWRNTTPVELRADALTPIRVTVENVRNRVAIRWQTAGRGRQVIPAANLYPALLMGRLRAAYLRFLKATSLAEVLKLTPLELAHLAADPDLRVAGEAWLNQVPVTGETGEAVALYRSLAGVLDFAQLKAEFAPDSEDLLEVLRDPSPARVNGLTRWAEDSVTALLTRFGRTQAELAHIATFRRVHDAYTWANALGVPAAALIAATTNDPSAQVVRDLQSALRARFDASNWLVVLKPINDEMRALQRDALVAQILQRMAANPASAHIDTPDKLFEFFLMDVQMDPSIQTSRIRHALSSVQLFVERCLMNLEPRVSPASLKAAQWEWMKRYRVWEANRKLFIHPENYLFEELRDNQSPLFRETMSELLQGDITEDRAGQAFVSYLTKLEEIAKLETSGVFYEQREPGRADDILHVVARTAGAKRKYFYRRREFGSWLPWDKITLDIEDNPVLPVFWRDRLFLFWLKVIQETQPHTPEPASSGTTLANVDAADVFPNQKPRMVVKALLSWSEFLGGQWQPARTSDPAAPLTLGTFDLTGSKAFDRTKLQLSAMFFTRNSLRIIVSNQIGQGSSFFLHNAFSTPELRSPKKEAHFAPKRTLDTSTDAFKVSYAKPGEAHTVLSNSIADAITEPHQQLGGDPWEAPFFYADARHVFYVTTDERLVPVRHWEDIGIVLVTKRPTADIPKLVFQPEREVVLGPGTPVIRQAGFGVVDPTPIDHFITEDVYLTSALGTPGTVRFGTRDIGPSGSLFTVTRQQ